MLLDSFLSIPTKEVPHVTVYFLKDTRTCNTEKVQTYTFKIFHFIINHFDVLINVWLIIMFRFELYDTPSYKYYLTKENLYKRFFSFF